jgi:surface antigen
MLVVLAVSMIASGAFAINTSVFLDAPITRLSADELEAFTAFVDKTLDGAPDGKTVEWKAPKTRFLSKLTPGKTFTESGRKCRELTIESDSHDRFQRGRYVFCKVNAREWRLSQPRADSADKQR